MLTLKDSYWGPVNEKMQEYFLELFFKDILALFDAREFRNDRVSLLTEALQRGLISYSNGEFKGTFNIQLSKELSKFAIFDGRKKVWRGVAPAPVAAIAVQVNERNKKLNDDIEKAIKAIPGKVKAQVKNLTFGATDILYKINDDIQEDYAHIGLLPEIPGKMAKKLEQDYTKNQQLNIKNWSKEQTERLRNMIQENVLDGHNRRNMIDRIESEYEVSRNKAKFLARQETSLFMSKFRRERFLGAGVRKYRWSSSHDKRVRHLHEDLNGKIFFFGSPPVSGPKGEREEPGEPFGCRCSAVPLLD